MQPGSAYRHLLAPALLLLLHLLSGTMCAAAGHVLLLLLLLVALLCEMQGALPQQLCLCLVLLWQPALAQQEWQLTVALCC